ncbi:MAG: hypothetical protein JJV91_00955 [Desulfosarcina sp.]|nr:hypothetical protein [Desulfobacterales bacterium]
MDKIIPILIAVEDALSEAVLMAMFEQSSRTFAVGNCLGRQGSGYLKKNMRKFNKAARGIPFFVLTDLDQIDCPPTLINRWLTVPKHENLIFRIAVREIESWLLAHREAFASFLGIQKSLIPLNSDNLEDSKSFLLTLTKKSKKQTLKKAIIPSVGSTAKIGPDYNGVLISFVNNFWQVKEASKNSPSLKRAFNAIKAFNPVWTK